VTVDATSDEFDEYVEEKPQAEVHNSIAPGACTALAASRPGLHAILSPLREFCESVEFISLGNYCLPSIALAMLGLRKVAYPFDYVRSSAQGVLQLFSTEFDGFLTGIPVNTRDFGLTFQNTCWGGSFWHHDICKPEVKGTMQRRVERLLGRKEVPKSKPRIFIRTVNSTEEIGLTFELYTILRTVYEGQVKLLTIIELQSGEGPIGLHGDFSNEVLFYRISDRHTMTRKQEDRAPGFFEPIGFAARLWAGIPLSVPHVYSLGQVKDLCDAIDGGCTATQLFQPTRLALAQSAPPLGIIKQAPSILLAPGETPRSVRSEGVQDDLPFYGIREKMIRNLLDRLEVYMDAHGYTTPWDVEANGNEGL